MYTRLNSRRLPSVVLKTENGWEISKDKSSILMKGTLAEGEFQIGPITCERHAVHVLRNPALGAYSLEVVTPDDGAYEFKKPAKGKYDLLDSLDWHYKVFIVRIDLPDYRD